MTTVCVCACVRACVRACVCVCVCVCVCCGGVGRTTAWPLCSVLCGLSAAGRYSNTHSLPIIATETKRQADVKNPYTHTHTRTHTHCHEQTFHMGPCVCSRVISIAVVLANRLWQCFCRGLAGWVGQVTFNYSPAWFGPGEDKTDSGFPLLSKHTTHCLCRRMESEWTYEEPPFPLSLNRNASHLITALFYFNEYHPVSERDMCPGDAHSHRTPCICMCIHI